MVACLRGCSHKLYMPLGKVERAMESSSLATLSRQVKGLRCHNYHPDSLEILGHKWVRSGHRYIADVDPLIERKSRHPNAILGARNIESM